MQWLDDLDDLVIVITHALERLRWPCLEIGFGAACALAVVSSAKAADVWIAALMWIALTSLVLWATGIALGELARLPQPEPRACPGRNA